MEAESLEESGPGFLYEFIRTAPFGNLVSYLVRAKSRLAGSLLILRGVFLSHEVGTVVQLLPLEDHLVTPSSRFNPLCMVVEILEMIAVYLLKEIIEEEGIFKGSVLLYKVPPRPVPLHMSEHWSDEFLSLLGGGMDGYGQMQSIGPVGILLPPFSPEFSGVLGVVAPPLDCRSNIGSTGGGRGTTSLGASLSLGRLAPLSWLSQSPSSSMRPTPPSHLFFVLGQEDPHVSWG